MIGKLTGLVDQINQDFIVLDVNGVGYLIYTHNQVISNIKKGINITLYIDTQIKEQEINLFGFHNESEKEWFKNLTSVQGVGNKSAMNILGMLKLEDLKSAIILEDKMKFQSIAGIGAKIATRIVNELKNKITKDKNQQYEHNITSYNPSQHNIQKQVSEDAINALISLGFSKLESTNHVYNIQTLEPEIALEDLIKKVLQNIKVKV